VKREIYTCDFCKEDFDPKEGEIKKKLIGVDVFPGGFDRKWMKTSLFSASRHVCVMCLTDFSLLFKESQESVHDVLENAEEAVEEVVEEVEGGGAIGKEKVG